MSAPIDDLLASVGLEAVAPRLTTPVTFTVIMRTQGRRPTSLAEALAAVSAQTHPTFDVLLMIHDPDPTAAQRVTELIPPDSLPKRTTTIAVQEGSRSRPLNTGLDTATGDYVCFLDDDDLVTPDWLAAFARGVERQPGSIVRAVTLSQNWSTSGGTEPVVATGPVERPFAPTFDLLAHYSHNETPICSIALPRHALDEFALRFDESLPVFEDWHLLMRLAPITGVTSIPDETSLYRRLDGANADEHESADVWHRTHGVVLDRLSEHPVLLPGGDARRLASAHFVPGAGSRHDLELEEARAELAAVIRSPRRWVAAFVRAALASIRGRIATRRR